MRMAGALLTAFLEKPPANCRAPLALGKAFQLVLEEARGRTLYSLAFGFLTEGAQAWAGVRGVGEADTRVQAVRRNVDFSASQHGSGLQCAED